MHERQISMAGFDNPVVVIQGRASLDGQLVMNMTSAVNGGSNTTLLTATSLVGEFASVRTVTAPKSCGHATPHYTPTAVTALVSVDSCKNGRIAAKYIAAIAVGAALGAIVLIVLILFVLIRTRVIASSSRLLNSADNDNYNRLT